MTATMNSYFEVEMMREKEFGQTSTGYGLLLFVVGIPIVGLLLGLVGFEFWWICFVPSILFVVFVALSTLYEEVRYRANKRDSVQKDLAEK